MWNMTLKRMIRSPIPAVGVLLFAVAMTLVLQSLHLSKVEAQQRYEEIYHQIDVTCTVTNLAGTKSDGLDLSNIIVNQFAEYANWATGSEILPLIENVQIKSQHKLTDPKTERMLTGITSLKIARELWPENGCTIFWNEGFDESIFGENALVCIIPQAMAEELEKEQAETDRIPVQLKLEQGYLYRPTEPGDYDGTMQVAGIYTGGDQKTVYCAWVTLMSIWGEMGQMESATAIQATLRNNDQVAQLRQAATAAELAEPDPNADPTDAALALDIDDSKLQQADLTLRNSLRVNELSAVLVFVLSAGAGFLIGFLMIRSRKREISLMRTMGTPNWYIYLSFAAEQMVCVLVGILLGGITYLSQPLWQLAVFAGVYFIGLSVALLIFLRKNLLTTIKED